MLLYSPKRDAFEMKLAKAAKSSRLYCQLHAQVLLLYVLARGSDSPA